MGEFKKLGMKKVNKNPSNQRQTLVLSHIHGAKEGSTLELKGEKKDGLFTAQLKSASVKSKNN